MVKKIISGGQTGADQAALDIAIKLGIPHGGWVPKERRTEKGQLDKKYQVLELETSNYNIRTEKNVMNSDGTLIFSHGSLSGGSEYTREMATFHNKPWLHIDLHKTIAFKAAEKIRAWIEEHKIDVLNVAGSRASKSPDIYRTTMDVLETAFYLDLAQINNPAFLSNSYGQNLKIDKDSYPQTVNEAVNKLLTKLSLRDKTMIANIPEDNLADLFHSLKKTIRHELTLWLSVDALLKSCSLVSDINKPDNNTAVMIIIKALWERLKKTNVLRIVK